MCVCAVSHQGTVHPTGSMGILLIGWKKTKTLEISGIFPGRIQEIRSVEVKES